LDILKPLAHAERVAMVLTRPKFQNWALCVEVTEESVTAASQDIEKAIEWARLAVCIAARVRGPLPWRRRVLGWALAHRANILRVKGKLKIARAVFERAKVLWLAGSDPDQILDPGRLLDLEASLCRAERQFEAALDLLKRAEGVSRCPAHTLINKGFTLEVMGEYESAVETLLRAEPFVRRERDPRLLYMWRFDLAVCYTHASRHVEAVELLGQVRDSARERGDQTETLRVRWLAGRIAAGLGRPGEARTLLEQARRGFATRKMWFDVALALLDIAALLLDEGRTAEVKTLARDLAEVFTSGGVHREALAALQLFREAAEQETATAELARRVLRYLYRARYDQGLRFES
jgi:tetratricopeptide (TPR) repeat protein